MAKHKKKMGVVGVVALVAVAGVAIYAAYTLTKPATTSRRPIRGRPGGRATGMWGSYPYSQDNQWNNYRNAQGMFHGQATYDSAIGYGNMGAQPGYYINSY